MLCVLAFSFPKTYPLSCVKNTVAKVFFPLWNTVSLRISAADSLFSQTVLGLFVFLLLFFPHFFPYL